MKHCLYSFLTMALVTAIMNFNIVQLTFQPGGPCLRTPVWNDMSPKRAATTNTNVPLESAQLVMEKADKADKQIESTLVQDEKTAVKKQAAPQPGEPQPKATPQVNQPKAPPTNPSTNQTPLDQPRKGEEEGSATVDFDEKAAICYAERYPDLFQGFCQNDRKTCRTQGLHEHYQNHGTNLVWGCDPEPPMEGVPSAGPESTYDWTDVNLLVKGACGWNKCFFPSIRNATIGYLIVSDSQYKAMKKADDVARDLHDRFGSKHFHLALDHDTVTKEFKDHINSLVVQPNRANAGLESIPILKDHHQVVIQKVLKAPEPAFFFAVMNNNFKKSRAQLNEFAPKIPDKKGFGIQLRKEYKRLVKVLDYMPGFVRDLQALIDIHGNFYHIDLDGHIHLQVDPLLDWEVPRAKRILEQVIANFTVGGEVTGQASA